MYRKYIVCGHEVQEPIEVPAYTHAESVAFTTTAMMQDASAIGQSKDRHKGHQYNQNLSSCQLLDTLCDSKRHCLSCVSVKASVLSSAPSHGVDTARTSVSALGRER
jgi:hypothetical protein